MPVVRDQLAKAEELGDGPRRIPIAQVAARASPAPRQRLDARGHVLQLLTQLRQVIRRRLHAHQKAVERRDIHAGRVEPGLERLDECRPRAGERIEHMVTAREIAVEQHLDELRDELAVVRVEPVDVLRPLALGQLGLRPREVEVQRRVQLVLGDGHATGFDAAARTPAARAARGRRARRSRRIRPRGAPSSGRAPSHASAARRSRRCFSAVTISSGSPNRVPFFSLTSTKRKRSRRAGRSGRARCRRPRRSRRGSASRATGTTTPPAARRPSPSLA